MAPRAYWKGYLRLSLVSCPISLFPATSERDKVSFHQINSKTGNRIRYRKVDEGTGQEVPADQIINGYEVGKGAYIEITDEELEAIALESTRIIEIDEFVPRKEIDELYNIRPYYIAPDGKVGQDAFVVIRQIIEEMNRWRSLGSCSRLASTSLLWSPVEKESWEPCLGFPMRSVTKRTTSTTYGIQSSARMRWTLPSTSCKRKLGTSVRGNSRTVMKKRFVSWLRRSKQASGSKLRKPGHRQRS
jgi:hypothetical protein